MNTRHEILVGPLLITLLATAFCAWCAFGNDVTFCTSAGCFLYQDFTISGISLWWLGTGVFAILAGLSLLGAAITGKFIAGFALVADLCLLFLMALTAPCTSCLIVACLFALTYLTFVKVASDLPRHKEKRSILLWLWILLFTLNIGGTIRSQTSVWPILDSDEDIKVRMFFSPSCAHCKEGINALSGHVDIAFYPVAETDDDIYKIVKMRDLLETGMNISDALEQAQNPTIPQGLHKISPNLLLIRFNLLRNKSHIFAAGVQTVPYFEYHGLPSFISKNKKQSNNQKSNNANETRNTIKDPSLPIDDPLITGQCGGKNPCP